MYWKNHCLIIYTFFYFHFSALAQTREADSLWRILETQKNAPDTSRILWQAEHAYQIRRVYTDSTHHIAQSILSQSKKIKFLKGEAKALWLFGFVYWLKENHEQGIVYFEKAANLFQQLNDIPNTVQAMDDWGYIYYQQGNYAPATEIFFRALGLSEKHQYKAGIIQALLSIGQVNVRQKEYKEALEYFYKGLAISRESKNIKREGECLTISGYTHTLNGEYDKAIKNLQEALRIRTALGDKHGVANATNNLGRVWMKTAKYQAALECFERALLLYEELQIKDGILIGLDNVADAHLKLGNFEKGIRFAQKGLDLAQAQRSNLRVSEAATTLYDAYKSVKNFDKANQYAELLLSVKDTIFNADKAKLMKNIEANYQLSAKQREILFLARQNELQQYLMILSGVFVAFLGTTAVFFYRGREREKTSKKIIVEQKQKEADLERELADLKVQHEKQRIARDLHDNVGSQLTILIRHLEKLQSDNSQSLNHLAQNTIQDLRNTVWAIQKSSFSFDDLVQKVQELVWNVGELPHTEVICKIENELNENIFLTPDKALNIFRIIQEALQNALKYSQATEIKILITLNLHRKIFVSVIDNGKGFDIEESKNKMGHYGLDNMHSRAKSIQADFEIKSQKELGTMVQFSTMNI
jgi:signal transduction histidine kinase/tetratricopeptide (TPR) repeat protein